MELTRRFLFRGNASALSGQFFRPKTLILDLDGASSLGVSGGISKAALSERSFDDLVKFASATTLAEGLYDDERAAKAVSNHKGEPDSLTTTTKVTAEIRELSVGRDPIFTAKRIRGALVSSSPRGSGEPSIAPGTGSVLRGIFIGGFELDITLNAGLFQRYDTRSKVCAAADDPKVVSKYGQHFLLDATIRGQNRRPGLVIRNGVVYTTIVESIKWRDKPYAGATIDGHVVTVDNFGKIFFGELLIASAERRLTMVRFDMGSPIGGWADAGGLDTNGSYYP
jgi:hypothetical protein